MIGELPREVLTHRPGSTDSAPLRAPAGAEVVVAVEAAERSTHARGGALGRVVAAADGAAELLGKRVIVPACLPCGECPSCRRAVVTACARAVRLEVDAAPSHLVVPSAFLCALEGALEWPADRAAWPLALLGGSGARAHHALSVAGVGPNELLVVVGRSPECHLAALLARRLGAHVLWIGAEAATAQAAGAHAADEIADVAALGKLAAEREAVLPWHVLAVRPSPLELAAAARLGSPAGSLLLVDPAAGPLPLDTLAAAGSIVRPLRDAHPDLVPELVAFARAGQLALDAAALPVPLTQTVDAPSERARIVILKP